MDIKKIEKKWQQIWESNNAFKANDFDPKPKYYNLLEFPYPSGVGMHIGHVKAFTSLEILSRARRLQGYNVLFPMGWDAFGLPTENYAIQNNVQPRIATDTNVNNMRSQMKRLGFSFDWSREVDTTDPEFFKWTQWIFIQMFKRGLAYRDKAYVNYCEKCDCILSNEESQGGECDRCKSQVVQKEKEVWFLKIRDYAERLLTGLDTVDFPEIVKENQRKWIGKSTGAEIVFNTNTTDGKSDKFTVYTTRADTLFGATFMVLAPEHPILEKHKNSIKNYDQVIKYQQTTRLKSEFDRIQVNKDKSGVMLDGMYAINPVNNKKLPIFIADYVMMGYGTGAIMAVPAHDTRDWEFAKKFNIDIIQVIDGKCDINLEAYTDIYNGKLINSDFLNGLNVKDAIAKMIKHLESLGIGKAKVNYQMKDWAFNRQRYWGEPFPIIYCPKCGIVTVPEDELPLKLPTLTKFKPSHNGESPLAQAHDWVNCKCPKCGEPSKRETDTMPQWAGSSWYFLRYLDPKNTQQLVDPKKLEYWGQVDWYNGGMEHVTRHLIYSRFWNLFLYDIGITPFAEPYKKRTTIGLVLAETGGKMSKSDGTAVDPMDMINTYGADVVRLYILFMGDYNSDSPWSNKNIGGCKRFLQRVERMQEFVDDYKGIHSQHLQSINELIEQVTQDIETQKYNTAIAKLMTFVNKIYTDKFISRDEFIIFVTLLYPFAPHITEELNEGIKNTTKLFESSWPKKFKDNSVKTFNVPVQINGKVKIVLEVSEGSTKEQVLTLAQSNEKIANQIANQTIINVIYVPNKILNIIIK